MEDLENLVTVVDDDGIEHTFEELDRIETEDGVRYIALIPAFSEDSDDEAELIILRVAEDSDGFVLEPIDNEEEFFEIASVFEERLSEEFEFEN